VKNFLQNINQTLQHSQMAYIDSDYTIMIAIVHRLLHPVIVQKPTLIVEL